MMEVPVFIIFEIFVLYLQFSSARSDFVVTTSSVWYKEETNTIFFSKINSDSDQNFEAEIILKNNASEEIFVNTVQLLNDDDYKYIVNIPNSLNDGFELTVLISIKSIDGAAYSFTKQLKVVINSIKKFVHIQTSKPLYWSSETIKVQALVLCGKIKKPCAQDNFINRAYVSDGSVKVMQWVRPSSNLGFYSFELPLSQEPNFGNWVFALETTEGLIEHSFQVERYAPKKFAVTISTTPEFVIKKQISRLQPIEVKVCAKHSYGPPIVGECHASVQISDQMSLPQIHQLKSDGCSTFNITISRSIKLQAIIIEKETGFSETFSKSIPMYENLEIFVSPLCPVYFIPGLPYNCKGWVRYTGNVPAVGVRYQVLTDTNVTVKTGFIGADGSFTFTIDETVTKEHLKLHLKIRLSSETIETNNKTRTLISINRMNWNSSSYIQIERTNYDADKYEVDPFKLSFIIASRKRILNKNLNVKYAFLSKYGLEDFGSLSFDSTLQEPTIKTTSILKYLSQSSLYNTEVTCEDEPLYVYKFNKDLRFMGSPGRLKFLLYFFADGEVSSDDAKQMLGDMITFIAHIKPDVNLDITSVSITSANPDVRLGSESFLHIRSPPNSICTVSVVSGRPDNQLTEYKVYDVQEQDIYYTTSNDQMFLAHDNCQDDSKQTKTFVQYDLKSGGEEDVHDVIKQNGLSLFTDVKLEPTSCISRFTSNERVFDEYVATHQDAVTLSCHAKEPEFYRTTIKLLPAFDELIGKGEQTFNDLVITRPPTTPGCHGSPRCTTIRRKVRNAEISTPPPRTTTLWPGCNTRPYTPAPPTTTTRTLFRKVRNAEISTPPPRTTTLWIGCNTRPYTPAPPTTTTRTLFRKVRNAEISTPPPRTTTLWIGCNTRPYTPAPPTTTTRTLFRKVRNAEISTPPPPRTTTHWIGCNTRPYTPAPPTTTTRTLFRNARLKRNDQSFSTTTTLPTHLPDCNTRPYKLTTTPTTVLRRARNVEDGTVSTVYTTTPTTTPGCITLPPEHYTTRTTTSSPTSSLTSSPTSSSSSSSSLVDVESLFFDSVSFSSNETSKDIKLELTEGKTKFYGQSYCVNGRSGFSHKTFSIFTDQPFFLKSYIPRRIVKGEVVVFPVTIISNTNQCIKVTVSVTSTLQLEIKKNGQSIFTLCNFGKKIIDVSISTIKFGKANISVEVKSESTDVYDDKLKALDKITKPVVVEYEGTDEIAMDTSYICTHGKSVGELFLKPSDHEVVRNSKKSFIIVTADIMSKPVININKFETLVNLPHGSAEHNLATLANNVIVLDFLKKVNRLSAQLSKKLIEHLKLGYQNQLSFKKSDGSFSAFDSIRSSTDLYLTAYTLKTLKKVEKHVFVDRKMLENIVNFFNDSVGSDGCFREVVSTNGGDGGGNKNDVDVMLNAYIVSSLLEADVASDSSLIKSGLRCLRGHSTDLNKLTLHDLVHLLHTYSLLVQKVGGVADDDELMKNLKLVLKKVEESEVNRESVLHADVNKVEKVYLNSYLLLCYLKMPSYDWSKIEPIAQWLVQQSNSIGGFHSTKDTVAALEALSSYTVLLTSTKRPTLTLTFPDLQNFDPINLNSSNQRQLQTFENLNLPERPIKFKVEGRGCVIIQAVSKMNILSFTGDQHKISIFNMSVGIKPNVYNCKEKSLHICFIYNGENDETNMAILSVKFPTGWTGDDKTVDKIKYIMDYKKLERKEDELLFYLDKVTKIEQCFHIKIIEKARVSNLKPAMVTLYDYYDPDIKSYAEYIIFQKCPASREKVVVDDDTDIVLPSITSISSYKMEHCPLCTLKPTASDIRKACYLKYHYQVSLKNGSYEIVAYNSQGNLVNHKPLRVHMSQKCTCDIVKTSQYFIISTSRYLTQGHITQTFNLDKSDVIFHLQSTGEAVDVDHDVTSLLNSDSDFCAKYM